jgi:hypothetical protein
MLSLCLGLHNLYFKLNEEYSSSKLTYKRLAGEKKACETISTIKNNRARTYTVLMNLKVKRRTCTQAE